jgi:hypothetical protein
MSTTMLRAARALTQTLALCAALSLSACSVPLDAPVWSTRWAVPGDTTTIGVAQFLPPGVALSADGSAFVMTPGGATLSMRLGDVCGACGAAGGVVAPKPAFGGGVSDAVALPANVASATLASGSVLLTLTKRCARSSHRARSRWARPRWSCRRPPCPPTR